MKETIELTYYDHRKGYGFAVSSNPVRHGDIFVHHTSFLKHEDEGYAIEGRRYIATLVKGKRGTLAQNVEGYEVTAQ